MNTVKPISLLSSVLLFGVPTIFFFAVAYGVMPYLAVEFQLHPAIGWFIGGTLIFAPLFIAAAHLLHMQFGFPTLQFKLK